METEKSVPTTAPTYWSSNASGLTSTEPDSVVSSSRRVAQRQGARRPGARVAQRGPVAQRVAGLRGRGVVRERGRHRGQGRHDAHAVEGECLFRPPDGQHDRPDIGEVGARARRVEERREGHVDLARRRDRGQDEARHRRVAGVGIDGEGQLHARGRRGDGQAERVASRQVHSAQPGVRQDQRVGIAVPGDDRLAPRVGGRGGDGDRQRPARHLRRHRSRAGPAPHREPAVQPQDVRARRDDARGAARRVAQRGLVGVERVDRLRGGRERGQGAQSQRRGQEAGAVRGTHEGGGHQRTCPATIHSPAGDGSLPSRPMFVTPAPSISQTRSPSNVWSSQSMSASPSPS